MEIAPELQFKHYTLREAQIPRRRARQLRRLRLRRRRDLLRPREPRLQRRAHRSDRRRGAARDALVRAARVRRTRSRLDRRLSRRLAACRDRVRGDADGGRPLPGRGGQEPARAAASARRARRSRTRCSPTSSTPASRSARRVVVAPEGTPSGGAIAVADPGARPGRGGRVGLDAAVAAGGRAALPRRQRRPAVRHGARPLHARRRRSRRRARASRRPPTGRRTRSRSRRPTSSSRSTGRGSAARFAALAPSRMVDSPNLIDDVDTLADLERLAARARPAHPRGARDAPLGAAA